MLNKSQIFNYITLILAVCTIYSAIYSITTKNNTYISVILMCFTLIFNGISRKINEKGNKLTEVENSVFNAIKNKSEEK